MDSSHVNVAVTGRVSGAPSATAAPVNATTPLAVAWRDYGYLSEDGVTEVRSRTTNKIKAWQGSVTVREVVTDADYQLKFVMLETNLDTIALYYAAEVTQGAEDGSLVVVPSATGGRKSFVVDVIDGEDLTRTYVKFGELSEVGDVVYKNGDPIGYEVTIATYPDEGIGGNAKKWFTKFKLAA